LLLALVEHGVDRGAAYRAVQQDAMRAWDEELDFEELVRANPAITEHLSDADLTLVFDLDSTIAHLDGAFDRLHRLDLKEVPVHA
jgi:adenylosuccinate lyase